MLVYYTKLAILYVGYFNIGIVVSIYGLFRNPSKTRKFARICLGIIEKLLGLSFEIKGGEFINRDRAYIVISNHQHALDVITVLHVYNKFNNIVPVAKHSLKWFGPFGLALQLIGTVFVKRGECLEESIADLNSLVENAKETGTSVSIFPEGTRHLALDDGHGMLPFKKGAFHMAIEGGFPILPVVIAEYDFIDAKAKIFESSKVIVEVLKPVETLGLGKHNITILTEGIRKDMIDTFNRNRNKKYLIGIV